MSKENDIQKRVDAYLRGELNPSEQASFESDLLIDPELKRAYKSQQLILEGLKSLNEEELIYSQLIKNITTEEGDSKSAVKPLFSFGYQAAAVILLLICAGLWYFLRPPLSHRLYDAYDVSVEGLRSHSDSQSLQADKLEEDLFYWLDKGEFDKVMKRYTIALEQNIEFRKQPAEVVLTALVDQAAEQKESSLNVRIIDFAEENKSVIRLQKTDFYYQLAMLYLQEGNYSKAIQYLAQIEENSNVVNLDKVKTIIQELEAIQVK